MGSMSELATRHPATPSNHLFWFEDVLGLKVFVII